MRSGVRGGHKNTEILPWQEDSTLDCVGESSLLLFAATLLANDVGATLGSVIDVVVLRGGELVSPTAVNHGEDVCLLPRVRNVKPDCCVRYFSAYMHHAIFNCPSFFIHLIVHALRWGYWTAQGYFKTSAAYSQQLGWASVVLLSESHSRLKRYIRLLGKLTSAWCWMRS